MTVIGGFSELILSGVLPPAEVREHLQEVKAASERAAALTRQILAFSRKQILLPCALNLNGVLRDVGGMVRRLLGSHIEFATDTDPLLGSVMADPTQLTQVVMNLALNARDAMPRGGRLTVRTTDLRLDEGAAPPVPGLKPGRYAVLEMTDTGTGMTDEVKSKVFEPFFTTKGSHGTGLGLSTVYGIVRQSGGDIDVASTVGRGSTFHVYLPVIEPLPDRGPDGAARPDRGTETILVADDDAGVRRVITMLLAQKGYAVLDASSGPEALDLARAHPGPIHMLLTDVVMPGMSGGELAQAVAPLRPGIKILFVSGYSEDALVERGLAEATATFLHKPFTAEVLTRLVRDLLDPGAV
ncbi:ATP-binding protein [Gemmata palustris]|uniref:ATP-binding protein n=1 Tax=Gemmata palustris TaxID=2822762 RepID=UPI001FE287C4|nr:ATP-binding protein [Gemmata palustris]